MIQERLRITPTPGHDATLRYKLVQALDDVWNTLGLKRTSDWAAIGGRAGVAEPGYVPAPRIWSDAQLGITATENKMGAGVENKFAPAFLGQEQKSASVSV